MRSPLAIQYWSVVQGGRRRGEPGDDGGIALLGCSLLSPSLCLGGLRWPLRIRAMSTCSRCWWWGRCVHALRVGRRRERPLVTHLCPFAGGWREDLPGETVCLQQLQRKLPNDNRCASVGRERTHTQALLTRDSASDAERTAHNTPRTRSPRPPAASARPAPHAHPLQCRDTEPDALG